MAEYFHRIEQRLMADTERIYSQSTHSFRASLRFFRVRVCAGVVAGVAVVLAVALVASSGGARHAAIASRQVTDAHHYQRVAGVPVSLQGEFVSLRRAPQPGDVLPPQLERILPSGTNYQDSRLVLIAGSTKFWFVPGPTEECIAEEIRLSGTGAARAAFDAGCDPLAAAETSGLVSTDDNGAHPTVFGIAPDGVSRVRVSLANGSAILLALDSQGAFFSNLRAPARQVSFIKSNGTSETILVGGGTSPPPSPNPCPTNASWCR